MLKLFQKRNKNPVARYFDGREVTYITKREHIGDNVNHNVITKNGRIVLLQNEIRIISGEIDIFRCDEQDTEYNMLLSGDGVTVEGINKLNGEKESYTAYYKYYRK